MKHCVQGKECGWPPEYNSHGDHLMEWKSWQDLSNQNTYSRGIREPFLLKIDTFIVYIAYFYYAKYEVISCFLHREIGCAIAGDQLMGMWQYRQLIYVKIVCTLCFSKKKNAPSKTRTCDFQIAHSLQMIIYKYETGTLTNWVIEAWLSLKG